MPGEPLTDPRVAVCPVVVEDQMQFLASWELTVQPLQKPEELLVSMSRVALPNDSSFHHIECSKQRRGAVAFVVVSERAASAPLQRQSGLSAIQRLNLALFIDAEHDGILRRSQIHADDIGELLEESWVSGEFEAFGQVRLDLMILPDAMDTTLAQTLSFGHGPETPVCASRRFGLEGRLHNPRNARLPVTWLASPSGCDLPDGANALLSDALAPERDRAALDLQVRGDFAVRFSMAGPQSNLCPEDNLLRRRASTDPLFQAFGLRWAERERGRFAWHSASVAETGYV